MTDHSHPMVLKGKNGWLFLSNDSNQVIEQITGHFEIPNEFVGKWRRLLDYRNDRLAALDARYLLSIIPNKECVYAEYLPDGVNFSEERPVYSVLESAVGRVDCRYFLDELKFASKHVETYSKGDTHWNHVGALIGFNCLMDAIGLDNIAPDVFNVETKEIDGDLSSKLGQKCLGQVASLKNPEFKKVESNGIVNVGGRVVFENENSSFPSLVLFRDSFASNQMQMFASKFSRVVALWQPNIDYSVVDREKPDFVISQQVERFLVSCPDDKGGPTAAEYEARKKALLKSKLD